MIALTRQGPQPAPDRASVLPALVSAPARSQTPSDNPADRAIRGGAQKPLSREQKTRLVLLAKEAYVKLSAVDPGLPDFDTWRVNEAVAACTRRIREARNDDFLAIRGRFRNHLGQAAAAFDDALNEATGNKRIAMFKLAEACVKRCLSMSYPEAICWKQFKCSVKDATEKQTWCLFFTVRNRRKEIKAPKSVESVKTTKSRDYTLKPHQPQSENPF